MRAHNTDPVYAPRAAQYSNFRWLHLAAHRTRPAMILWYQPVSMAHPLPANRSLGLKANTWMNVVGINLTKSMIRFTHRQSWMAAILCLSFAAPQPNCAISPKWDSDRPKSHANTKSTFRRCLEIFAPTFQDPLDTPSAVACDPWQFFVPKQNSAFDTIDRIICQPLKKYTNTNEWVSEFWHIDWLVTSANFRGIISNAKRKK